MKRTWQAGHRQKMAGIEKASKKRCQLCRNAVQFTPAGPCALWRGQPGQVGNEAATAISCKCRRQGSPLSFLLFLCTTPQYYSFALLPVYIHAIVVYFRQTLPSIQAKLGKLPQCLIASPAGMLKPIVVMPSTLLANTPPPCILAIALTIASPRPWPCNWL